MHTLDARPALVLTAEGEVISIGTFHLTRDLTREHPDRIELAFETETMACRVRVPHSRIEQIKASWDGTMYRYQLPAGSAVWKQ